MAIMPPQPNFIIPLPTPPDPWFIYEVLTKTVTFVENFVHDSLHGPQLPPLFHNLEPGTKLRFSGVMIFLFCLTALVLCGVIFVVLEMYLVSRLFKPTLLTLYAWVLIWRIRRMRRQERERERQRIIRRMRFIEEILREGERRGFGRRGDGPGY